MIRVNLAGTPQKKKGAKAAAKAGGPSSLMPVVHLLILIATAAGGYFFYAHLTAQSKDLADQIQVKEAEEKKLEALIKADSIYESRKADLEKRIKVIDDLKKSQISPVVMLDRLADSVDKTHFVWLSSFSQNNSSISMVCIANSIEAMTQFYGNLDSSGYFHNINLQRFEDTAKGGNVNFNLTADFAPPVAPKPDAQKGAN